MGLSPGRTGRFLRVLCGTLCEGFLKAAKVLRLNNPDGAASDESIREAGG
jgi:hypothetical protein